MKRAENRERNRGRKNEKMIEMRREEAEKDYDKKRKNDGEEGYNGEGWLEV